MFNSVFRHHFNPVKMLLNIKLTNYWQFGTYFGTIWLIIQEYASGRLQTVNIKIKLFTKCKSLLTYHC